MKQLLTTRAYKSCLYIKPTMAQKKGAHVTLEQKITAVKTYAQLH